MYYSIYWGINNSFTYDHHRKSNSQEIMKQLKTNANLNTLIFNSTIPKEVAREIFNKMKEFDKISELHLVHQSLEKSFDFFVDYLNNTHTLKKLKLDGFLRNDKEWDEICEVLKTIEILETFEFKVHFFTFPNDNKGPFSIDEGKTETKKMIKLIESIQQNKNLHSFSLGKIPHNQKLLESICSLLSKNNNISTMQLSFFQPLESDFRKICDSIKSNKSLTSVSFLNSGLKDEHAEILSHLLGKDSSLKELDLTCNDIKQKGYKSICEALKHNKTLEMISLCNNNLFSNPFMGIHHLLNNHNNELASEGIRAFSNMLYVNNHIKELDLSFCYWGGDMVELLKEGLEKNESLRVLRLDNCAIVESGAKIISELLKTKKWEQLYLDNNRIENKGVTYIFSSLKNNHYLKTISLNSNKIMNDGMKYIFNSLKQNDSLKTLFINNNNIVESGYLSLIELLQINHSLTDVINYKVGKFREQLDKYLQLNQRISGHRCWTFDQHQNFEEEFKLLVKTFLLCQNRILKYKKFLKLPKPIFQIIIRMCAVDFLIKVKKGLIANQKEKITNNRKRIREITKQIREKRKKFFTKMNSENNDNNQVIDLTDI